MTTINDAHLARVYVNGAYVSHPVCCDAMANAFNDETDNEGWGALAYFYPACNGELRIGSDALPAVRFCPWCGKPQAAAGPAR